MLWADDGSFKKLNTLGTDDGECEDHNYND